MFITEYFQKKKKLDFRNKITFAILIKGSFLYYSIKVLSPNKFLVKTFYSK